MDIIYSRNNFKVPKFKIIAKKKLVILLVLAILICILFLLINGIYPIFIRVCESEAHNIATKISNEEVRKNYEELYI